VEILPGWHQCSNTVGSVIERVSDINKPAPAIPSASILWTKSNLK